MASNVVLSTREYNVIGTRPVVQGIGWALNEEYTVSRSGEMTNSSFLD